MIQKCKNTKYKFARYELRTAKKQPKSLYFTILRRQKATHDWAWGMA